MRPSAVPNARKPQKSRLFKLNTFTAGLSIGLLAAALLALYITQSPLPFVDRIGAAKSAKTKGAPKSIDETEVLDPNKGLLLKDAGQTESPSEAGIETKATSPSGLAYLLQVGAFKSSEDAEQMRARMAILGFEARVSDVEREGTTLHRVRLGPYVSIEELNKAKGRLSENGVDSTVVRVTVRQ